MKRILTLAALFILTFGKQANAIPIEPFFSVGEVITGSFKYDVSESPQDQSSDPTAGTYVFTTANSFITVSIGSRVFSSAAEVVVRVTDGNRIGNSDFIQIRGTSDKKSFKPFLNGFSAQEPSLEPLGAILLNFHFPHTYLQGDALPASIDPLATVGPLPGSSFPQIFGQIEGISRQTLNSGQREWAIFFLVDANNVSIVDNEVSGTSTGLITEIDDRGIPVSPPVDK